MIHFKAPIGIMYDTILLTNPMKPPYKAFAVVIRHII